MRVCLFFFLAATFAAADVSAQKARVKQYTAPLAGKVVLGNVEDKYNASVENLEAPDVENEADKKKLREIKELLKLRYPRKATHTNLQKKTTAVAQPIMTNGFIADSLSGIPPDNYCAVSNGDKAVSVMNSSIAIHDANSGDYLLKASLMLFSKDVGLTDDGITGVDYRFDPKVIYDPEADKFICVMLNSTNQYNWIVVGFSKTNDPAGEWNFYKFYGDYKDDTTWFDYPAISITHDEFFLTGNKIRYGQSWQAGFKETLIYQVNKESGYRGDTVLTYQIWDNINYNNKNLRCLHPVKPANGILGPDQYFLSNRNFDMTNDSVFLVKVPNTIASGDTNLTVTPLISSLPYGVPPNGLQPDTTRTLATNDGRVLGAFVKDNEIQFVSVTANPANGNAAIYHGIISNFRTHPTVFARLISNDTLDFGYPNISYTGSSWGINNAIITYEFSGRNRFPGYGGVFFDGSDYSDMLVIKEGENSIVRLSGKEQRWGDYSGSQPDWDAPGAIWVDGIFGKSNRRYGSYMARLTSPYYTSVPAIASQASDESSRLYPAPAWQFVHFEFNVIEEQAFSFVIYDISGRVVDKVLDTYCRTGKNEIQLNIASLSSGTYFLKAIGKKGEVIPVHKLIRQ